MNIGLIDVDGKLPNLALMKISAFHKAAGDHVEFAAPDGEYDKIYASAIFTRSRPECEILQKQHQNIEIGGTGWDLTKRLPPEIEACRADYDLYTAEMIVPKIGGIMTKQKKLRKATEIVSAGIGFTSRGCIRSCGFCIVPKAEGPLRQDQEIRDIINPRSDVIILHDNNITADPYCIDKLHEIRDRGLTVDINQGCDVRLMTPEIAQALSEVKHLRSLHYAWDLMKYEEKVLEGIKILKRSVKAYRQMCYMLVGFNTTFEEDMYRFRKLTELGIDPYVMIYNQKPDTRLKHFARWVNSRINTVCAFDDYEPWVKAREQEMQLSLFGTEALI